MRPLTQKSENSAAGFFQKFLKQFKYKNTFLLISMTTEQVKNMWKDSENVVFVHL